MKYQPLQAESDISLISLEPMLPLAAAAATAESQAMTCFVAISDCYFTLRTSVRGERGFTSKIPDIRESSYFSFSSDRVPSSRRMFFINLSQKLEFSFSFFI